MIDESLLDGLPLFERLTPSARREIAARSVHLLRQPGDVLWREGDPSRGLVVVLEGSVRIVRGGSSGRRVLVHREGPGISLGEVPLFDGGPYPATAEAETTVSALLVTPEALDAAIVADPRFARELLAGLARRVRHLVGRLDALTLLDVRGRLARHLLRRAAAAGDAPFTLGTSQARLAEDLGTVREVVVRNLGYLRRHDILRREGRGRYRIVNRAALEALAEPSTPQRLHRVDP